MLMQTMEPTELAAWAAVIVNALLFFVVIAQAEINRRQLIVTGNQTETLNKTLEHTRTAHYISERAYIGVSEITDEGFDDAGHNRGLRIIFKNGGRTPAWNFGAVTRVEHVEDGNFLTLSMLRTDPLDVDGVFLISGETTSTSINVPVKEYSQRIATTGGEVLICGEATYQDFQQNIQKFRYIYKIDINSRKCTELPQSYIDWKYVDELVPLTGETTLKGE